jgi:hypothetical protein
VLRQVAEGGLQPGEQALPRPPLKAQVGNLRAELQKDKTVREGTDASCRWAGLVPRGPRCVRVCECVQRRVQVHEQCVQE